MALLCLGGIGVFISFYDEATKIERTAPDAVVDQFLRAYLVNRDDKEAELFTCKNGLDLSAITALRTELIAREKEFDVTVNVSWSTLTVSGTEENRRTVTTDLLITGSKDGAALSKSSEPWSFALADADGWRVCSTAKIP
ncbi:hypothetical protein [Actinoplanes sp. NPDC049599]|uniref:hypothetical protein n=1 Tax=Actinoplanes sp. NPDC049599 TaxID=3363903 RepID=UPI0037A5E870